MTEIKGRTKAAPVFKKDAEPGHREKDHCILTVYLKDGRQFPSGPNDGNYHFEAAESLLKNGYVELTGLGKTYWPPHAIAKVTVDRVRS